MRILAIDVGMGTADILAYDSTLEMENCPKLVAPSATMAAAGQIRAATRAGVPVIFRGVTMGGGPCAKALKAHLEAGLEFYATPSAALTFNDDLDRVRSWGVSIIGEADSATSADAVEVCSGDVDVPALTDALESLKIDTRFDGAAVAVQDHGFSPDFSNRRRRFQLWREILTASRQIDSLAWRADRVPGHYSRMRAAAGLTAGLGKTVVMDTGPAAILGVQGDANGRQSLIVNVGNGHTLAAIIEDRRVSGLVEHHTGMLDSSSLERMLRLFAAADLTDEEIFQAGGHGCIPPAEAVDLDEITVKVTGPRRSMTAEMGLKVEQAAPYGDMMLTGCFGLVEAWKSLNAGPSS